MEKVKQSDHYLENLLHGALVSASIVFGAALGKSSVTQQRFRSQQVLEKKLLCKTGLKGSPWP
jgi:hypothetical protein